MSNTNIIAALQSKHKKELDEAYDTIEKQTAVIERLLAELDTYTNGLPRGGTRTTGGKR
ncbi:MAG: hypothetical protein GY938_16785 [Ketobacter sp.]|nr:hypothetical protein [Ketobacter sp.]